MTDEEGVQTSARSIAVIAGSEVLALTDIEKGLAEAVIDVSETVNDKDSVLLIGADPIDEVAVVKADPAAKKAEEEAKQAQMELDELSDDATPAQKKAAEDKAKAAAEAAKEAADAATKQVEGVPHHARRRALACR